LVISIEGTRSYGAGLARAAATAGLAVIEAEQPTRKHRRGKDKSDRIDAHLAVLYALGLDADKLPTPRADGDREALRILLCARQELTTTATGQTNRLRALLRDGEDTDRRLARARLTDTVLASLARRRLPAHASRQQAVRHSEIRRLALALRQAARALSTNRAELAGIVHNLAPGLLDQPGIGPVSAAQVIVSFSHAGRCRSDAAFAKLAGNQPDRGLQRPDHPPPAQSRWGPGAEQSPPRHRNYSDARRPRDPGLPRAPAGKGQSDREIRRCLKRYIARQLFRALTTAMTPATATST
jgi:transposase